MKKHFKIVLMFSFIFLYFFFSSCSENSPTKTIDNTILFRANQIPGCNSASIDSSCFSYTFNDTLKIDFCLPGNCCPDSNRFVTNYSIKSDTLFVTVVDTAANLCNCICTYINHIEITGLPNNSYLFYCVYQGLTYNEVLIRTN
jgi:hypothetical protein